MAKMTHFMMDFSQHGREKSLTYISVYLPFFFNHILCTHTDTHTKTHTIHACTNTYTDTHRHTHTQDIFLEYFVLKLYTWTNVLFKHKDLDICLNITSQTGIHTHVFNRNILFEILMQGNISSKPKYLYII